MAENKMFAYAQKSEMLDDENSIVCYASTNEVDRHNEMILASAWTEEGLKNYRMNPVILVNHDYWSLPVAKSIWQKTDSNGLKFKIKFADTEAGNEIYSLYKNGFMSSFSVGFRPVRIYDNEKSQKYVDKNGKVPCTVYEECELLELSCVTIPANPSATIINGAKSMVASLERGEIKSAEVKSMVEKLKDSKEYIELTSEPTEEKAKVIGHIDIEGYMPLVKNEDGSLSVSQKCEGNMSKMRDAMEEKISLALKDEESKLRKAMEKDWGSFSDESSEEKTESTEEKTEMTEVVEDAAEEKSEKDAMPCDGEDGSCDGENCPQYEGCDKPTKKSLDVQEETKETMVIDNQEDNTEEKIIDSKETETATKSDIDKFQEILEEIKSIRAYVDEKIEKTLKFPEENADKVYTEKVKEKDVIDFEIKKQTIDLDFTPEDVKKMVIESVLSAKSKTQSISDLVEERIKKAKGIIF